ncbi:34-kDa subunit of RNA polymerase III (C) [Ceratobasidium sp. UAMH 11750]|nr:34-kDa subunit of RNA polymerase III (C) [Ceratobasidium sp. UAMH 11750]
MSTLTPAELEVYQACSEAEDGMLRQKELEKKITIQGAEMAAAVNGLLKKSLLKVLKDSKGVLSYQAVDKAGAKVLGLMDAEESIVYKKIQEAKNEGIWTKHLKSTELHQSIITRVLKSLEKKGLIKSIKSVKHPTRKIYILANLEPSAEVSGGPWYNNSEFETEFVQTLCNVCLNYIQKRSFPVHKPGSKFSPRALYPVSETYRYPTAADVLDFLKQSNVTDAPLDIAHVEDLLQVLIFDGTVEVLPGPGLVKAQQDDESDEDEAPKKKKAKKDKPKKKGKKRARDESDEEDSSEDGDDSDATAGRGQKRQKRSRSNEDEEMSGSGSGSGSGSDEDEDEDEDEGKRKKSKSKSKPKSKSKSKSRPKSKSKSKSKPKSKSKSKSKSRRDSSDSSSESDSSESQPSSESESEPDSPKPKSKSKPKTKKTKREPSPIELTSLNLIDISPASSKVYRAIRRERVALGWTQSPCAGCPQFDFCHDDGPVNARECQYYTGWLDAGVADEE